MRDFLFKYLLLFFCFCCLILPCLLNNAGLDRLFLNNIEVGVEEKPCAYDKNRYHHKLDFPAGTHRRSMGGIVGIGHVTTRSGDLFEQ
jgi:hypothetical protein